jgi:O-methyltransferase
MIGRIIKWYFRSRGFDVALQRFRLDNDELPHGIISPRATYSPWLVDVPFRELYEGIKPYTKVDVYRCYELWQLAQEVRRLKGNYLEVGVWRGGTGAIIAAAADADAKVFLCDTFEGVVMASSKDSHYLGGEHKDASEAGVNELLSRFQLGNTQVLKGIFPDETASFVNQYEFKFCHIDVDVFEGARAVTEWVWPRLVRGGVLVYDDYGFRGPDGVTKFVETQRGMDGRVLVHNLNGHAIIIKV